MSARPSPRLVLVLLAGAALLAGMWAGLVRLGWQWPALQPRLPLSHGPLMVSGFFGTLILLERAVAIRQRWAYLGALLNGVGGLLLVLGLGGDLAAALLAVGAGWMVLLFVHILQRHAALHTGAMAAGALCWLVGALAWLLGAPVSQVVMWWQAFLVLTIAGERLELSRVMGPTPAVKRLFTLPGVLLVLGCVSGHLQPGWGARLAGLGLIGMAVWLLRYDIASRTIRRQGLTRYIALCLLLGYAWLAVGGAAASVFGAQFAGPQYDLTLHAVFLGFVMSMVFGHAPIIFPAVLARPLIYHPRFYAPLALLHGSLLLRLLSDLLGWSAGRLAGGLLNALAILVFAGLVVHAVMQPPEPTAMSG